MPRSRFSPVKTVGDLLLAMSDCFRVTGRNAVECSADWRTPPEASLDPGVYSTVDRFIFRFPEGVPLRAGTGN